MSLYKCIKNTSSDRVIVTEGWLNTSRRPWSRQERSLYNQVGQKKEGEKKRRGSRMEAVHSREGVEGSERFLPERTEIPFSLIQRSVITEGENVGLLEESETTFQAWQSKTFLDGQCHSLVHPSLECVSTNAHGSWVLECENWRADPRKAASTCEETCWGGKSEAICNRECKWRNLGFP